MQRKLNQTIQFIKARIGDFKPQVGIILGTGLGQLAQDIDVNVELNYSHIPNFPISTVDFHSGKLIFGFLNGCAVVAMQGRLHYYEGYSLQQITFPVRIMKLLGVDKLFVSNASGSLNPKFKKGDLVCICDHINLLPDNPLRGMNLDALGPRFPDMSRPYDTELIERALLIAKNRNYTLHKAVYVAVSGPNLETPAEYKYLKLIGGDIVGMSTVPEVIVANHMSLPVFAISVVTDEGFHENPVAVTFQEIVDVAMNAEPQLTDILKQLLLR